MAIQSKRNFLGAMRVDVSMLNLIESGVASDFSTLVNSVLTSGDSNTQTYVVRGFGHTGTTRSTFTITLADSVFLSQNSERAMFAFPSDTDTVAPFLNAVSNTYYWGFRVVESDAAVQQFAFKDPITNVEYNKQVPTAKELAYLEPYSDTEGTRKDVTFIYKVTVSGDTVTVNGLADIATNKTEYFLSLGGTSYGSFTEWANDVAAAASDKTVGTDLSGTYPDATVVAIQNNPVGSGILGAPDAGKVLAWSGSAWAPASIQGGGGGAGGVFYLNYPAGESVAPANSNELSTQYDEHASWDSTAILVDNSSSGTLIRTFVTNVGVPSAQVIPAGVWDLNLWAASSGSANDTAVRVNVGIWNGSTFTVKATSEYVYITGEADVAAEYKVSVYVPEIDTLLTDRVEITIEGRKFGSPAKTVTAYFGNGTISHVHTTINAAGGTGLMKVVDGYLQSPATLLVDADVSATAAISQSKVSNLTTDLAARALTTTQVIAGTGLTGGGTLAANRTLTVSYGTTAGTAAQGNDSRFASIPTTQVYDMSGMVVGKPLASEIVLSVPCNRTVSVENMVGLHNLFVCRTKATSSASFLVRKRSATGPAVSVSSLFSVQFTSASYIGTVTDVGSVPYTVGPNEVLEVVAASVQDATLADVSFTIGATVPV